MKPRLHLLALRDEWSGEDRPRRATNLAWEPPMPGHAGTWRHGRNMVRKPLCGTLPGQFRLEHFDYVHPTRCSRTPRR